MQNTATITICVWKLKLLRMETLVESTHQKSREARGYPSEEQRGAQVPIRKAERRAGTHQKSRG